MSIDTFTIGFGATQSTARRNLAGVSHAESLRAAGEHGNCLNWIAGHVLAARERLLTALGEATFLTDEERAPYRRGAAALSSGDMCVPLERISEGLAVTHARLLDKLQAMTPDDFERLIDPKMFPVPVPKPTVEALIAFLMFHEAYHVGQLGLCRRVLGMPSGLGV